MKTTGPRAAGVGVTLAVVLCGTHLTAQSPSSTMSREVVSATGCVRLAAEDGQGEGVGTALVLKGVRIAPAAGLVEAPRTPRTDTPVPSNQESAQGALTAEPGPSGPPAAGRGSVS